MTHYRQVPLMLSLPEDYRNKLRVMAAEMNLKNPRQVVTAASLGRKIIMDFLDKNASREGQ
jgi:hypothetical protein